MVGVQSEKAPAAFMSWKSGELVSAPCGTRVSGLATDSGSALPQAIMRDGLDDFLLVSDDDIMDAIHLMAAGAHTLAEGAGAAGLAGLLADPRRKGVCAVVCTGGNADNREMAALGEPRSAPGRRLPPPR